MVQRVYRKYTKGARHQSQFSALAEIWRQLVLASGVRVHWIQNCDPYASFLRAVSGYGRYQPRLQTVLGLRSLEPGNLELAYRGVVSLSNQ
jgi:hypothetical protein